MEFLIEKLQAGQDQSGIPGIDEPLNLYLWIETG